ncbi:MAG: formate C-acetyltransferase [Bacillota bacterium]
MEKSWFDFNGEKWKKEINVRNFIINNFKSYLGDERFLKEKTKKTKKLWEKCEKLLKEENEKGLLGVELNAVSGIDNFKPGYIDKKNEVIYGLQTDRPLKRIINPFGGIRMVESSLKQNNIEVPKKLEAFTNEWVKTHNQGVFDAYTEKMRKARTCGLLTGLPDAYGRGRIIGDYRRISLYGIDYLIKRKKEDLKNINVSIEKNTIQLRENVSDQINALKEIKNMAKKYKIDISKPAKNSKEAVQFLYFGYLASVKENNGAAMSLGRVSTFLDIYIQRDLNLGKIDEKEAQELIDQFVIKLRFVRHLRTKEYNELFAGDPTWITESIGGMSLNGKPLVTKTSFRFLHTLNNLGPSPEPNMTILWSKDLPENFKKYCTKLSIETGALQYENDMLMSKKYGDDYSIACCVSPMKTGKEMQYFGARCNLAKILLYSLNGGIDEIKNIKVIDGVGKYNKDYLEYEEVLESFKKTLSKVAKLYVETMNIIHYMHNKYAYEASQMALHDTYIDKNMAFGVAGLSVIVDSLSAIKFSEVKPIYENGLISDYKIKGDYPKYGNNDQRVDDIAKEVLTLFMKELKKYRTLDNSKHTLSVLTITSNVVYGEKTGNTPDGRKKGKAFAPGANPMHSRDQLGALASLKSVSKLPFIDVCEDGISNTFTIIPTALGQDKNKRVDNLKNILDGYFLDGAQHLNVNVIKRDKLIDAQKYPEKYPNLTIRVSGYAVKFNKLNKKQQDEVISRTFHKRV